MPRFSTGKGASAPSRTARQRSQRGSSQIAEFAPTLYILFLLVLVPLLDLGNLFIAGAAQYLATNDFAAKAATQGDYSSALNAMVNEAYQFQSTGFAKFVHMQPQGGYTGCGDDLYVLQTDVGTGTVSSSMADQPLPGPIDTKASMYEISVQSVYSVAPLISLASVPGLGSVPGLAQPVTFAFTANRPVEHPGGLQSAPGGAVNSPGVTPFNRIAADPGNSVSPTSITWRNPNIFQQIQQAGQTVASVTVLVVPAIVNQNGSQWIPTGINLQAGQNIWLDTQAVGTWQGEFNYPPTDANGYGNENDGGKLDAARPLLSLIGYIGVLPPFGTFPNLGAYHDGAQGTNPRFVPSGDSMLNFPVTFSGPLSLTCNDGQFSGESGFQMVRVIVTQ